MLRGVLAILLLFPSLCWAGASRLFDGSNDYLSPSSIDPHNYDSCTIAVWYKSTNASTSDDEYIYIHRGAVASSGADRIILAITDDVGHTDQIRFILNVDGVGDTIVYGTTDVADQAWHFLAVTRDVSGNALRIYKDGTTEVDQADIEGGGTAAVDDANTPASPFIGDEVAQTEQVDGNLAYLHVYDRALTDAEIQQIRFRPGSVTGSLVGYWPMWGSNSPEVDLSGNGNNANLPGGTSDPASSADGPPVMLTGGGG